MVLEERVVTYRFCVLLDSYIGCFFDGTMLLIQQCFSPLMSVPVDRLIPKTCYASRGLIDTITGTMVSCNATDACLERQAEFVHCYRPGDGGPRSKIDRTASST